MKIKAIFTALLMIAIGLIWQDCQLNPNEEGARLYRNNCQSCHQENGAALKKLIPPLAGSDYLTTHGADVACIIRYGLEGPVTVNGVTYDGVMAGLDHLNAVDITNILNYINNSWGNDLGYINLRDVEAALDSCKQ